MILWFSACLCFQENRSFQQSHQAAITSSSKLPKANASHGSPQAFAIPQHVPSTVLCTAAAGVLVGLRSVCCPSNHHQGDKVLLTWVCKPAIRCSSPLGQQLSPLHWISSAGLEQPLLEILHTQFSKKQWYRQESRSLFFLAIEAFFLP